MGKIHAKISAVLIVYDSYLDKRVENGRITVTSRQGLRTIQKGNGYFIFLEQAGVSCLDLEIKGAFYQTRQIRVELEADRAETVIVRLEPARQYPFTMQTTFLRGRDIPAEETVLILEQEANPLRLLSDSRAGESRLTLFGLMEEAGGRQLRITDTQNGHQEYLTIRQPGEGGRYEFELEKELGYSYQKGKTVIQSVYPVRAQEDGSFFLALQQVPKDGCQAVFYGGKAAGERIFLDYGRENEC